MKKQLTILILLIFSVVVIHSCTKKTKSKSDSVENATTPSTSIPAVLKDGSWFTGTVSAISYYDRDGYHLDHDYEAGREFIFYESDEGKGRVKFWQYLGMKNYSNCVTEIYTLKEGTVAFDGQTFTFYPFKGSFKTIKDKCSSGNGIVTREATEEDLMPVSYRWEMKMVDGHNLLYTYSLEDTQHENVLFVYEKAQ